MDRISVHKRDVGDLPNPRNSALLAFHRTTGLASVYIDGGVVARKPTRQKARGEEVYLRAWRNKFRRTLEWMAAEIGSDKGTLSEIETRDDADGVKVRGRWLYAYSVALGVSPDQLLRHPDSPPSVRDLVDAAPADLQEHIRGIVAHIARNDGR